MVQSGKGWLRNMVESLETVESRPVARSTVARPSPEPDRQAAPRVEARPNPPAVTGTDPNLTVVPLGHIGPLLLQEGRTQGAGPASRLAAASLRLVGRDRFPERFARAVASVQEPVTTGRRIAVVSADGGAERTKIGRAHV